MASEEVIKGIETAALECSLCLHRFTRPKTLTCVHSFCLECLKKWVKERNGVLSCPICREVCQIPEGGLQNLKNNIFISGLLDYVTTLEQKTAPTCNLCSTEACFVCLDCDELYCTPCNNYHKKMKMSQHHCNVTMKEYAAIDPLERLASKSVLCSEHNMQFHFYCDSCETPVCVGCMLIEHPQSHHNIVKIKTAFESFSIRSQSLIKTADERLGSLQSIANELKKKEALEMSTYKKRQVTITEEADKAHQLIDQYKTEQLQDLESTYQHNLKLLNVHVSDVELAIAKLSSMQGIIARTLIHSPNHAMALKSSSDVSKRIDDHLKQNVITDDMQKPNVSKYNSTRLEVFVKSTDISKITFEDMYSFRIKCITRDSKGAAVYKKDVKVKCFRINQSKPLTNVNTNNCMSVDVTDKNDGHYIIDNRDPFTSTTLICLIINGSDVLFKTVNFDSRGVSKESAFTLI